MRPKVFVYGTLKTGFHANELLDKCAIFAKDAKTTGRLYNLGWYPGLLLPKRGDNDSIVIGELYTLPDDEKAMNLTLARLDGYEGVPTLYRRQLRYAHVDGAAIPAFMYVYQGVPDEKSLIADGVWKR